MKASSEKIIKKAIEESKCCRNEWSNGYNAGVESASTLLRAEGYPHLGKIVKKLRVKKDK